MSRIKEFKLPDLGEGLTEGEILKWLVGPGDEVRDGQPIVEVETAKAAVEVPSPYTGVVTKLFYDEGTTVDVGQPIIAVDTDPGAGDLPAETDPKDGYRAAVQAELTGSAGAEEIEEGKIGGKTSTGRTAVLVGYGVKETTAERRPRRSAATVGEGGVEPPPARVSAATVAEHAALVAPSTSRAKAKPPVRKLAKDLGVDLSLLHGTGPNGSITRDDVQAAVSGSAASAPTAVAAPRPVFTGERETRIPIKGVRKLTAQNMVASAFTAPHVTEFITVDVTPMMELRKQLGALPEFAGLKVTPLALVARALVLAVRRNPEINATWDEAAQEIVVKHYVNLGIAAATPRGLMVPNIKDAQDLALPDLVRALNDLTATAKDGKTPPADMQGGTITITNVGVFGVDNGTPILNPGEAAILCFGAVREQPWVHEGQIAIRQVTQLSLSFDHRMVDGQLGSQFLADVARCLSDPAAFVAWS
ncbi:MAG TPA: dihydrolipoamide acetyltransferase family protein [Mycobacteriales bacterium]|jgi:pyruvate dehydrogenase E2 component (dihydrolipoamide acetyltransferase)|nr:dihydrolipoamide acetyltransferase family protein [Mycobacteriales bacterium]